MIAIKKWLCTLNLDPAWQNTINNATNYEELERIVQPIVSEIGWLNLAGLAGIIDAILENRNKSWQE